MIRSSNNDAVETAQRAAGDKSGPPPLEFRDVYFSYRAEPALENISFVVPHGDFMAIIGPNGSGKTTLMRLALGLLKPDSGQVLLYGQPPDRFTDWSRIGYVPQKVDGQDSRYPATVREVVGYGLYTGIDPLAPFRRSRREKVDDALELVGLQRLAGKRASDLSVGQQQRMLIARVLVKDTQLLFLDEPVAGVDSAGQEQFSMLLRRLNEELNISVVIVSHDIGAVMREAKSCACINCELVFHGPVHQITSHELSRLYGYPVDVLVHDALHEHR